MVDRGEEARDVALERVIEAAREGRGAAHRGVVALAAAAGVGVLDEAPLEERLDHAHDRVVHHAVPEGRRGHRAPLRIVDLEVVVGPVAVAPLAQLAVERHHLGLEIGEEGGASAAPALAAQRRARRGEHVLEAS